MHLQFKAHAQLVLNDSKRLPNIRMVTWTYKFVNV